MSSPLHHVLGVVRGYVIFAVCAKSPSFFIFFGGDGGWEDWGGSHSCHRCCYCCCRLCSRSFSPSAAQRKEIFIHRRLACEVTCELHQSAKTKLLQRASAEEDGDGGEEAEDVTSLRNASTLRGEEKTQTSPPKKRNSGNRASR